MKKYFAKLDGDIVGIDTYIRFEAKTMDDAQEFADQQAEEHYSGYDDPYDDEESPKFFADVQDYNSDKHDDYFAHIKHNEFEILS